MNENSTEGTAAESYDLGYAAAQDEHRADLRGIYDALVDLGDAAPISVMVMVKHKLQELGK